MNFVFTSLIFLVLISLFGAGYTRNSCSRNGRECKPSSYTYSQVCGERKLINKTTYNVSGIQGYGPNVCKTEYLYGRNAYRHQYTCYHYYYWGYYRCNCYCKPTSVCDVPVTLTKTEYHCCDGYTTSPMQDSSYSYWYEPHSKKALRREGCPIEIQDSIIDCINELDLTGLRRLLNGTDLEMTLRGDGMFTLFALPNELITNVGLKDLGSSDIEEVLNRHVIGKKLESGDFFNGQSLETQIDDCFVHVTEIDKYKKVWHFYRYKTVSDGDRIFISGSEIEVRDACIARNGIVHIVTKVIECGNATIADIVQEDSDYSIFESLLSMADLLSFLDKSKPLLTLLIPTNQAFDDALIDLEYDLVACLKNNTDVLRKFLKYHIVCGAEFSCSLVLRDDLKTKACKRKLVKKRIYYHYYRSHYHYYYVTKCQKIEVDVQDSGILLGEDGVLLTGLDIAASNGVIHEISLPLLNPKVDFNELCGEAFARARAFPPPPPMAPPPQDPIQ